MLILTAFTGCISVAEENPVSSLSPSPSPSPSLSPSPSPCLHNSSRTYSWHSSYDALQTICTRIHPPSGYTQIKVPANSFADWLRHLPLKKEGAAVYLHSGRLKPRQDVHAAVIDIDAGDRDLQQCADAVMRLRGEYLYSQGRYPDLHFNYTSGHTVSFDNWREGYRPEVRGSNVKMVKTSNASSGHASFRKYMDNIFTYAGTLSLTKEMKPVNSTSDIMPGDVFIIGGSPGHAMIVVDVAEHNDTKKRVFLIAQSYMPAQDLHVVKNIGNDNLGAWYAADFGSELETPEWTFGKNDLKRFE